MFGLRESFEDVQAYVRSLESQRDALAAEVERLKAELEQTKSIRIHGYYHLRSLAKKVIDRLAITHYYNCQIILDPEGDQEDCTCGSVEALAAWTAFESAKDGEGE